MNTVSELALFISHSSVDVAVAKAVVELIEKATKLTARQIRCTSVAGYRLPVGADTDEELRREVFVAKAFVGLITPTSAKSAYVLFELGARWGAKRHLAPVLACGADVALLGGPVSSLNALSLTDRNQVLQLVQDIAEYLELQLEPIASFQGAVDVVVSEASKIAIPNVGAVDPLQATITEEEIKVLEFLASGGGARDSTQVAAHLGVPEQKSRYYLDELDSKGMVGWNVRRNQPTEFYLKKAGRAELMKQNRL